MKEKISNLFPAKRNAKTLPIAALVGMLAMSYPVTHAEESATPPNQATGRNGGRNGIEFSTGLRWAW